MSQQAPAPNHVLGILLSFLGYAAWAGCDVWVKLASATLPVMEIVAVNFAIGTPIALVAAAMSGGVKQIRTRHFLFHILRWALVMGWVGGCVAGVARLPLADFYTILFSAPLIIAALGYVFLGERLSRGVVAAIVLGFAGVVFAVRFSSMAAAGTSLLGAGFTFFGAVCMSGAVLMVRVRPQESHCALTFWSTLGISVAAILWVLVSGTAVFDMRGILFASLSGVVGAAGSLLTNASLRLAPAGIVAPYQYAQIAMGSLLGYLVWGSVPEWPMMTGALLVVASGLYIFHQARNSKQKVILPEWG